MELDNITKDYEENQNEKIQEVENNIRQKETQSSMSHAGIFFFLVMFLEIPVSFVVAIMGNIIPAKYYVLLSVLVTQGYLLACGLLYLMIKRKTVRFSEFGFRSYKISSFFLSLIVLLCASPMATWLNLLSQLFAKNEISTSIYEITQVLPAWLAIVIIGCLPGFVEELLYRGVMYNAFRKRSVLTGVIVSALAFGLMHMNFNQIMYAVYLGVVFAFIVEATGSLFSSMILHMLFNAVNTAYLYILPKLYDFLATYSTEYADMNLEEMMNQTPTKQEVLSSLVMFTPMAFVGLFLVVLLLKQIAKLNGRELSVTYICGNKEEVKQTKPWNVPLILGCAFCVVIAVASLM